MADGMSLDEASKVFLTLVERSGLLPICVFCEIVAGNVPATIDREWDDCIAFHPRNPVTDGHLLVVPRVHRADASVDPAVTAAVMGRAAELAMRASCNLITSVGAAATQTVMHLHVHVVPRRVGDGLMLPWSDRTPSGMSCSSTMCSCGEMQVVAFAGGNVFVPHLNPRTGELCRGMPMEAS